MRNLVFILSLLVFIPFNVSHAETLYLDKEMVGESLPNNKVWAKITLRNGESSCGLWSRYCPQGGCESCVVKYLIGEERDARKLTFDNKEKIWRDKDGLPYDTATENKKYNIKKQTICDVAAEKLWGISPGIWVVDTLGNLYTSVEQSPGVFHHSSFMAGGLVRAAGQIVFKNGKIIHVNNSSGHYKPDQESLNAVIKNLRLDDRTQVAYDVSSSDRRSQTNMRESAPNRSPKPPRRDAVIEPELSPLLYDRSRDEYEQANCYNIYEEEPPHDYKNSNN